MNLRGRTRPAGRPLLSDDVARQLERLSLADTGAVLAGLEGDRRGVARAQLAEPAEYRAYQPGDDLRMVDWNGYLRLGELYVRTAFAEQGLVLVLLLDCSASMAFGSPTKLERAKRVAAALGAVALLHGDTVRLHALADGQARTLSTPGFGGRAALRDLLAGLERLDAGGGTRLVDSMRACPPVAGARAVTVLVSDLLVPREHDEALDWVGAPGAVLQVLDPPEDLPPTGRGTELQDAETGEVVTVTVTPRDRRRYLGVAEARSKELARRCAGNGLRYVRVDARTTTADLLFRVLPRQGVVRAT